jgi:hypothetical protein
MQAREPLQPTCVRTWAYCRPIGVIGPLFVDATARTQHRPLPLMVHLPSWSLYLVAKDTNAALAPWCLPSERPIPRQAPLVRLLTAVGCEPGPAPAPAPGSTPVPPGFRAVNPVVVTATAAMLSLQCVQQCLCQQLETLEATRRTQLQHKWRRSVLAAKRRVSLGDINLIRDTQRCVEDTVAVLARAAAPALGPVLAREWGIGRAGAPAAAGAGAGCLDRV